MRSDEPGSKTLPFSQLRLMIDPPEYTSSDSRTLHAYTEELLSIGSIAQGMTVPEPRLVLPRIGQLLDICRPTFTPKKPGVLVPFITQGGPGEGGRREEGREGAHFARFGVVQVFWFNRKVGI